MKTVLWLDDWRDPYENPEWVKMFSPIPFPDKVYWVKTYTEFVEHICYMGLPDAICFDHDLGDIVDGVEKTGVDCVKALIEYLKYTNEDMPLYGIQSSNPVGKERMINLIEDYKKGLV